MNVLKLANISRIIEGNKKPQILSVIHFSSGNPYGLLFLLNSILSLTVILKIITVIIWLLEDNRNVRTQFEAAGRCSEGEHIMTNWKTRALWQIDHVYPKLQRGIEKKRFNCSWLFSDKKRNHCHVKFHRITTLSINTVIWKKHNPSRKY